MMKSRIIGRTLLVTGLVAAASNAEAVIAIIHDLRGSVESWPACRPRDQSRPARRPAGTRLDGLASCVPGRHHLLDIRGQAIGDPNQRTFTQIGETVSARFLGGPDTKPGTRVQIRGQVSIGNPGLFPGCRGRFAATLEVIDRLTRKTEVVLQSPVIGQ